MYMSYHQIWLLILIQIKHGNKIHFLYLIYWEFKVFWKIKVAIKQLNDKPCIILQQIAQNWHIAWIYRQADNIACKACICLNVTCTEFTCNTRGKSIISPSSYRLLFYKFSLINWYIFMKTSKRLFKYINIYENKNI